MVTSPPADSGPWILGLSALSAEALGQARLRLADRLAARPALALADAATTLARGRERFPVRFAVVGGDRDAVIEALRTGAGGPQAVVRGANAGTPALATVPADAGFTEAVVVADAWCAGQDADLTRGRPGRRVRLPGYPFERRGNWESGSADADARALTPHEQRWLFHDLARSGSSAGEHNQSAAGRIAAPADLPALDAAFARLQQRHPLLRTVFERHGGGWQARVLPEATVALTVPGRWDGGRDAPASFELVGEPLVRCAVAPPADAAKLAVTLTVYEPMAAGASATELLRQLLSDYEKATASVAV